MAAAFERLILSGAARVDPQTGRLIRIDTPASQAVKSAKDIKPEEYSQPFLDFINNNPTVFHTVDFFSKRLESEGFVKLSERDAWDVEKGGKYYVTRNGSALVAFAIPEEYEPGNGVGES
jgi:aminopeptidase I